MITPEGTEPEKDRPLGGRLVLAGLAALAIFAGLIAVGSLTAPDEDATTASTSTTLDSPADPDRFNMSQMERGQPLEWESSLEIENGFPLELLDHGNFLYLFAIDAPDFSGFPASGLRAWRSADGTTWETLGQVIPEDHVISAVTSTGQGLIALEPGSPGTGFTVWRSPDGVEWEPEDVTVDTESNLIVMRPVSSGGAEGLLVVSGTRELHVTDLIRERLGERFGDSIQMGPYGWSAEITLDDQLRFNLHGPVGLPLASVTADELKLTEEERDLIAEVHTEGNGQSIWVETASGWTVSEIPDAEIIQWIGSTPDRRVIAIGYGSSGLNAWATRDGSSWESLPSFPGPYHIDSWRGRIVGPSTTLGAASVLVLDRDGRWEDIGPAEHLADALDWSIGGLGAGPGGVAAIVNGWGDLAGEPPPERPQLTDGGATLTLEFRSGEYHLETDGGDAVYTWAMGGNRPGGMEADLAEGTLSFRDPATGEPLGTFDFTAINGAANSYWSQQGSRENVQALAFTNENLDWTIQDLATLGETEVNLVEVSESRVVAAGIHEEFNPTTAPGFSVWSAPLP